MRRWPMMTRWQRLECKLFLRKDTMTEACASFSCRNSGPLSAARNRPTPHIVPTLPTPTNLTTISTKWNRSNSTRICSAKASRI